MIDAWSRDPQPNEFRANQPDGVQRIVDHLKDVPAKIREATSSLLNAAGISVDEDGMTIETSLAIEGDLDVDGTTHITGATDIDGTLNVDANTTIGGTLNVTGNAAFSGDLDATGDTTIGGTLDVTGDAVFSGNLAVPNGSIDNDALANPVTADAKNGSASGVTLTTTVSSQGSMTFTVPAGFTSAVVFASSSMYAGGLVATELRTRIDGVDGDVQFAFTNAAYSNAASSFARTLTGLSGGGTFQVMSRCKTTTGTTTASVITSAMVTYYR